MCFTSWSFYSKSLCNCHCPSHEVNGTVTHTPGHWPSFTNWVSEAWTTWIFLTCQGIREGWGNSPPVSFSTDTVIFSWGPGINFCPASLDSQGFLEASSGFMTWISVPSTELSFPFYFSMISRNLTIPRRVSGYQVPGTRAVVCHFVFLWSSCSQYWRIFQCQQCWSLYISISIEDVCQFKMTIIS